MADWLSTNFVVGHAIRSSTVQMMISFAGFVGFSIGLGMVLSKMDENNQVIISLSQAVYTMTMKFMHHVQWSVCVCVCDAPVLKIMKLIE